MVAAMTPVAKDQEVVVFHYDGTRTARYQGRVTDALRINCRITYEVPGHGTRDRTFRMDTRREAGQEKYGSSYGWSFELPEEVERSDRASAAIEQLRSWNIVMRTYADPLPLEQLEELAAVTRGWAREQEGSS